MPETCKSMPSSASSFGTNLRKLRTSRGLTQTELAELTGMAQNIISRMESAGSPNPTYDTLRKLAAAFGMSVTAFVALMEGD